MELRARLFDDVIKDATVQSVHAVTALGNEDKKRRELLSVMAEEPETDKTSVDPQTNYADKRWKIPLKIVKADADQRLIFGWASVVEKDGRPVIDKQGDIKTPCDVPSRFSLSSGSRLVSANPARLSRATAQANRQLQPPNERASVDTCGYICEVRRGIGLSRMIDAVVVQVTRSHGHRPAFLRNIYVPVSLKEQAAASGWRLRASQGTGKWRPIRTANSWKLKRDRTWSGTTKCAAFACAATETARNHSFSFIALAGVSASSELARLRCGR
jgi:hypothetical protein